MSLVFLAGIDYRECRKRHSVQPAASEGDIEGCLSLNERAFELHTAVYKAYGHGSMVFIHVSGAASRVDYRR